MTDTNPKSISISKFFNAMDVVVSTILATFPFLNASISTTSIDSRYRMLRLCGLSLVLDSPSRRISPTDPEELILDAPFDPLVFSAELFFQRFFLRPVWWGKVKLAGSIVPVFPTPGETRGREMSSRPRPHRARRLSPP